jgi:hypothetical protein
MPLPGYTELVSIILDTKTKILFSNIINSIVSIVRYLQEIQILISVEIAKILTESRIRSGIK